MRRLPQKIPTGIFIIPPTKKRPKTICSHRRRQSQQRKPPRHSPAKAARRAGNLPPPPQTPRRRQEIPLRRVRRWLRREPSCSRSRQSYAKVTPWPSRRLCNRKNFPPSLSILPRTNIIAFKSGRTLIRNPPPARARTSKPRVLNPSSSAEVSQQRVSVKDSVRFPQRDI